MGAASTTPMLLSPHSLIDPPRSDRGGQEREREVTTTTTFREMLACLERLESELGDLQSGVCTELIQGRAAEQICGWAEQHDVDLTVLCSHGARGITDWDLASTARKLIRPRRADPLRQDT